jgi:methionyl-tRNA formyltransferase
MGSPEFAVPSLRQLSESGHQIAAVVSGSDKKRGRGNKKTPTPVKAEAEKLGLKVIEADDMKSPELAGTLKNYHPDLFVVVAFKILPASLLEIPKLGSVNLHASLLPEFRGAAPIHHAVMQGKTVTGCTVFRLNTGIDTGGIIGQASIDIGQNETTGELYERLRHTGASLLAESIQKIADGTAEYLSQDDSKATKAPKLFDKDCRINFSQPALQVHNQIRGLSPFPTAYAMLDGKKLKLMASLWLDDDSHDKSPGTLELMGQDAILYCKPGRLRLLDVKYEGKKKMPATDFMRGYSEHVILD